MGQIEEFEAERARLVRLAAGLLGDRTEAEDILQQAWIRFHGTASVIENVPAWLTVVTTRLCLDRLRSKTPEPREQLEFTDAETAEDPADHVVLADTVGVALHIVLERLSPPERVAFILHDTFGVDFRTIASVLDISPQAARKLASRARSKVTASTPEGTPASWEVVDAFLTAARSGDFARLLHLLAPDALLTADTEAIAAGTPRRIEGRHNVAAMFDGAAKAALPVLIDGRPGAAWFQQGQPRVAFDFTISGGLVQSITFRARQNVLTSLARRTGNHER
ncbi:sigma-70 family RNA polymerase sigma factor [Nesterenkonia lutea]|uniref:RNA polymerase sigma-70 factor (ECF subfamily) n=1 Tax=Nesterenkonia lutea TaxID=272919 RepID=A0ABR9JHI2_9MICC|nr:sigma-70 family RNA polymerase sigma factor [Nesterenkonia lutea]MBE1525397.1 RNA polymerase sigma-70 factor (ECF subfamily) [Nesterenkonia lutea]